MDTATTTYEIRPRKDGQYEIDRDGQPLGLVESIRDAHDFIEQDHAAEGFDGRIRVDLNTIA